MGNRHENIEPNSLVGRRTFLKGALASAAIISAVEVVSACSAPPEFDAKNIAEKMTIKEYAIDDKINLATMGTWRMIGARQQPDGLLIQPTYSAIEDRDTGDYQHNPPIAIFGTHLRVPDAWQLSARVSNTEGFAMQCYGKLPLIRDDYRIENESVRLELNSDAIHITSWQNDDEKLYDTRLPIATTDSPERDIQLYCDSNQIKISVDGAVIGTIDENNIFKSRNLWLGFDTATETAQVSDLRITAEQTVTALDTTTIRVPKTADSLQALASKINPMLHVGATVAPGPLAENRIYDAIALGGNYGSITLENAMKPIHLMPRRGITTFEEADAVIDLAQKHDIAVHGHTLVFGESLPDWMRHLPTRTAAEKIAVKNVMEEYIETVADHFKGRVESWDVINEPLAPIENDNPEWREHLWYQAMGKEYIEIALRAARLAYPKALLFINENAIENDNDPGSRNRWCMLMNEIVLPMKQKGLIDGVGIQGHVAELPRDAIDPATLTNHLRELESHGLLGRISEIDVDTNSQSERAEQYASTLRACLMAKNCVGFTMWGVMGGYENQGLVWDQSGRPLLAVKSMQEVMKR